MTDSTCLVGIYITPCTHTSTLRQKGMETFVLIIIVKHIFLGVFFSLALPAHPTKKQG